MTCTHRRFTTEDVARRTLWAARLRDRSLNDVVVTHCKRCWSYRWKPKKAGPAPAFRIKEE